MISKTISHYKILEKLGEGGMGVVYKAQDLKLDRIVALKFLPPEFTRDPIAKQRFINEAKSASALDHPNICTVHDVDETPDGELFIAMAYYEGDTLQQKAAPHPLSIDDAISFAIQIAEGLQAAHKKGIVHRDIKSSNIMVTTDGQVKIMDFGLARTAGGMMMTKTGTTVGTVPYMSPEQARGEKVDHRTDIWSFGVVMYEMIAGRLPFQSEYSEAVVYSILNEQPKPLTALRRDVPIRVENIVRRMLSKDPEGRYQSIDDLLTDVQTIHKKSSPIGTGTVVDVPNNLPNPATRFFGRQEELARLTELLAQERLVTLQGPGGCGKTRLAIELARRSLGLYPDGVWFVSLAQLTNPDLVAEAVAEELRVRPEMKRSIEHTIAHRISPKRMLVVLDNCEHVVDECARLLDVFLTGTQTPRFLATSRETVKVPGEAVFSTPSLPAPQATWPIEEIVECDSVLLFRDRASLNNPGFRLDEHNAQSVGAICRRLDGIPLAIEMAASRVKAMGPETILQRLSDQLGTLSSGVRTAPARHQTLRATIDWSNALLTEEERMLFHRLSVFDGDFDLEDAEGVCGFDPLSASRTLDLLTQLLDKSLLVPVLAEGMVRYSLLEIMKQYGREQLATKRELDLLGARFCDFYLARARVAYKERLELSVKWLGWVSRELYNLQGVLYLLSNDPERRMELAGLLGEFLFMLGRFGIGREILGSALKDYSSRDVHRARALGALGYLEVWYLDFETGRRRIEEGTEIVRDAGDVDGKLDLYWLYGMVKTIDQEWDEARAVLEQARSLAETAGDPWLAVRYRWTLNWVAINQLRPDLIDHDIEACLQEAIARGHPFDITICRHIYADVPLQKGDFKLSEQRYIEATRSALGMQNTLQAAIEMQGVAMSVAGQGRLEKGLRLFGAALGKWEELGAHMVKLDFWVTCIQRTIGKAIEAVGPERALVLDGEGRRMGWERALEYAFDPQRD